MATGSYDANGIWQYGEDDNIALFSDLLNLATESTSDAFTDDRARIATLESGSLAGLIPVIPSSVTAVTGTAAVSTDGAVTFTGCSKVILNGVFSSEYRNYRVVFTMSANTTAGNLTYKFATGGTENSSANYNTNYIRIGANSAISYAVAGSVTSAFLEYAKLNAVYASAVFDVTNPERADYTTWMGSATGDFNDGSGNKHATLGGGMYNATTQFDGISFISPGIFTGAVQVFGYND